MKTCKRGHTRDDSLNRCKDCSKLTNKRFYESDKKSAHSKVSQWRKSNPRKARSIVLKHTYGLTIEQYDQMLANQDGRCPICNRTQFEVKKTFVVDHDHITGKIRQLLCEQCNLTLGTFDDDPIRFDSAAAYLRKHLK